MLTGQPPSSSGPSRPKAVARGRDRHDGEQGRRPRRSRPPPVHSSPLISRKGAANTGSFGPAANSSSAGLTAGKAGYAQDHGQGRRARGPHNGGRDARVRPGRGHRWERPRANPGRGYGPRHAPRPRRGSGDHRIGAPREPQGYCKPAGGAGIGADGDRGAVFAAEPASGEEIGPRETLATVLRRDSAGGEWRSRAGLAMVSGRVESDLRPRGASSARRNPPQLAQCELSSTKSTSARFVRAHLAQCELR